MNDSIRKLNLFLEKVAEYSGMNETEKSQYFENLNQGLLSFLIGDGKNIVSKEILEKIKKDASSTTIQAYLKEMAETEKGAVAISKRMDELAVETIETIKDSLSDEQKKELLEILEH